VENNGSCNLKGELTMTDQTQVESGHHYHEHRKAVLDRLARIEGHVRAVRRMVEEDVPCPEVLVQIAAVRSALNGAGRIILEDHVKSCMIDTVREGNFENSFQDLKNSLDKFIR
jgi:CsoR family transcriptional regulator, copper-sensing transcriptional repressor